jgi:tyrosyl-tRNA synthetase
MQNFIQELSWRGMLHDAMPETENQLQKEMTAGYIGFDPTADSLHIGNLAAIMLLVHFQHCGHKPIALVGGATGMIGDPSGKSSEREFLSENALQYNQNAIQKQLEKFLNFEGKNAAEVVNNYDWFKEIGFLQFLREAGKSLTVNYMMAKDSVKTRLESGNGISFTEFSYQLLQGYDFYHLYTHKNCKLQMGASDQWGNITTGTELIRRLGEGKAYALTCPLLTRADGTKYGKTADGETIWLSAERTSPYKFYQFLIKQSDADAMKLIKVFSLKTQTEIEHLIEVHQRQQKDLNIQRFLQKAIAEEITERVHGKQNLENAQKASNILFGKDVVEDLKNLDEKTLLDVFEGVPQVEITRQELESSQDITDFVSGITKNLIFKSKGEARKAIQNNAVSINKIKISDAAQKMTFELLQNKYLLAQSGKTAYFLIKIVSI